ncbi:hypothetical protein SAMN05518849_13225 [Sphingobium sp. AP50]|uniref:hypothetical protein n=1 Tax=Sphingobium sp. AP50 TaxID=1884369 RepID=UPI0008D55F38|nr:hypothetical protein [Sphingobium sp. AP50]SEK04128.1 hypothetical protein SAMN05518849_13225 [Sphingobium sp. AP50]
MRRFTGALRHSDWQHGAFCLLHLAGFAASTLLMSWGLFVLFFLALGGFSLDGLMHHLANLASRYVAAAPDRAASFGMLVGVAQLLFTAALIIIRRHHILPPQAALRSASHV